MKQENRKDKLRDRFNKCEQEQRIKLAAEFYKLRKRARQTIDWYCFLEQKLF